MKKNCLLALWAGEKKKKKWIKVSTINNKQINVNWMEWERDTEMGYIKKNRAKWMWYSVEH